LLSDVQDSKDSSIVSFLPHGRAFIVHDKTKFMKEIIPKYFNHSAWLSFTRQLSLYGFRRSNNRFCPDYLRQAYYHELFLRGHKGVCLHMQRVGLPKKECDRRMLNNNHKAPLPLVDRAPNFYALDALE
jgi:hypothetical protein